MEEKLAWALLSGRPVTKARAIPQRNALQLRIISKEINRSRADRFHGSNITRSGFVNVSPMEGEHVRKAVESPSVTMHRSSLVLPGQRSSKRRDTSTAPAGQGGGHSSLGEVIPHPPGAPPSRNLTLVSRRHLPRGCVWRIAACYTLGCPGMAKGLLLQPGQGLV